MSFNEQLLRLVRKYLDETGKAEWTTREVASWAISEGHWKPERTDLVEQISKLIAKALREEFITDPQGRQIRAKHAVREDRGGEQQTFWADIRSAPRRHMRVAFQQRRNGIVADCRQLKDDVDSYNDNWSQGVQIEMSFNFTRDLEEIAAAAN